MKNKEELKKVNEVRECTNEELAQVTGGRNTPPSVPKWSGTDALYCPYCRYWFPDDTPQQEIDDHINNCPSKPKDSPFENESPFPDFGL